MSDSELMIIAVLALVFSLAAIFAFLVIYRRVEKNPYDELLGDDFDKKALSDASAVPAVPVKHIVAGDDDMDELVAVFAAVAAYYEDSGVDYKIKSIRGAGVRPRSAWAAAGIADNTKPF